MKLKKMNKILIIFCLILAMISGLIWNYLSSEQFANLVNQQINSNISKIPGLKLSIKKIQPLLFPPGLELSKIEVKYQQEPSTQFQLISDKVEVAFNLFDFFTKKVSINFIKIKDGSFSYLSQTKTQKVTAEQVSEQIKSISQKLLSLSKILPVKVDNLFVEKLNLLVDSELMSLNLLEFKVLNKKIVSNLELDFISGILSQKINYIHGSVIITEQKITLSNFRAYGAERNALINGEYSLSDDTYQGHGRFESNLKNIHNELSFSDIGKIYNGAADVIFSIGGKYSKYRIDSEIVLEDVKSDFINIDKLTSQLIYESDRSLRLSNVVIQENAGKLDVLNEFTIYDFIKREFIPEDVRLKAHRFQIKNILTYVQDSMSPLNAEITGILNFKLNKNGFSVDVKEDVQLDRVDVVISEDSAIKIESIKLQNSLFELNQKTFYMNVGILIDDGKMAFEGKIDSKALAIIGSAEKINLEKFDKFAFLKMKGSASFNIAFTGTPDSTQMDANLKFTNYTLEDFYLGEGRAHILFNFSDLNLLIPTLVGKVGVSNYTGQANLNLDKMIIKSSNIQFKDSSLSDILLFHAPISKSLNAYKNDVLGLLNLKYSVTGEMEVKKLSVNGSINADGISVFNEYFNSIKSSFEFKDFSLSAPSISIKKDNNYANAKLSYDLNSELFNFQINGGPFQMQRLAIYAKTPLKLESDFKFNVNYKSIGNDFEINSDVEMMNTRYETRSIPNSRILINYSKNKIAGDINLFDEYKINCNIELQNKNRSKCKLKLISDNLENVLGGLLGANIRQQDFDGEVDINGDFSFNYPNWSTLSTSLNLNKFFLRREDVSILIDKAVAFNIVNGQISKVKEIFTGNNANIAFHFSGDLATSYDFGISTTFKSSILSLISPKILRANGLLTVDAFLEDRKTLELPRVNIKSDDLEISIDQLPLNIKKAVFDSYYQSGTLHIKKLQADLDSGKFSANGSLTLEFPYPNISMNFQLEQAKINLFEFADTIFSGKGTITGSQAPYYLSGDVLLNRALVKSLPDTVSKAASNINNNPYLPRSSEMNLNSLLRLNLALKTQTPINFINNLMDMGMSADVLLQGPVTSPRAQGIVQIVPRKSKVYFKNSEYIITRGDMLFNFERSIENPEIDVSAQTNINNYVVKVRTFGALDSINFDFASEPPLSQQDILSLVAFGYTDDVSQRLSDVDRQNLSSIGVGQFLFGQLQINQKLKQSLGVELNLGTQFEMQSTSLLNARTSDGDSSGRVRSATKIQLKKQLSEEMELSVSSTLGGSIGQRQSMNLNYNINRNTSLEGIYEIKSNDEGEEDIIDKSVGADVKFKWSF